MWQETLNSSNSNNRSLPASQQHQQANASTRPQAASTLSPSLTTTSLRQSRYSPLADEFMAAEPIRNHNHLAANNNLSASQTFRSPARGAASFIPRAYNSASRYSVLGNLNRRNRSVSQNDDNNATQEQQRPSQAPLQYSGNIRNTLNSNEVDHSIDLGSDFSKFLFEEQLADIKIHVSKFPQFQHSSLDYAATSL